MGPGPAVSGQESWLPATSVPKDVQLPVEGKASADALPAQPWEVQGGLTSGSFPHREDRIKEFLVSLCWEPERLFLAPGGRVLLLIYLSSYFWTGLVRGFFWVDGGLSSSKSCNISP